MQERREAEQAAILGMSASWLLLLLLLCLQSVLPLGSSGLLRVFEQA